MNRKFLLIFTIAIFSVLPARSQQLQWSKYKIDGSRTGVTMPTAQNVPTSIGTVDEKGDYTSPNGRVFKSGTATAAVAALMLDAQPTLAPMKEKIGYAPVEMKRRRPQCELSNWFIDFLMQETARQTGRKVDVGIYNYGGIRADMPKGDITVDDITSMFPFRNTLCYVSLKGYQLYAIFEQLAAQGMQVVGGVKLVIENGKVVSVMVGDEPFSWRREYGVATINFLLNGGDGLNVAKEATEVIVTDIYVKDAVIPYVKELTRQGKEIKYHLDDRVVILDSSLK